MCRRRAFIEHAIGLNELPKCITIDRSRANTAQVLGLVSDSGFLLELQGVLPSTTFLVHHFALSRHFPGLSHELRNSRATLHTPFALSNLRVARGS